jgi:hypothetical protein
VVARIYTYLIRNNNRRSLYARMNSYVSYTGTSILACCIAVHSIVTHTADTIAESRYCIMQYCIVLHIHYGIVQYSVCAHLCMPNVHSATQMKPALTLHCPIANGLSGINSTQVLPTKPRTVQNRFSNSCAHTTCMQ